MIAIPDIKLGKSLTIQKEITEQETAGFYGSGALDKLFSTPALVALMLEASAKLIDEQLPEGFLSVTQMAQVIHEKPTVLGEVVSIKVEVTAFDGNKVQLAMHAFDEIGQIGLGSHVRAIVNKSALYLKASEREAVLENHDF
jgi:fluoroacetyl-CoA thioesterase